MPAFLTRIGRRLVLCLALTGSILFTPAPADSSAARDPAKSPSPPERSGTSKPLSLEAWRAMKKEAEALEGMPAGPGRIAACEAFLKAHPDYPGLYDVLRLLVDDSLQNGESSSDRVAALVERMEAERSDDCGLGALYLVEHYHLRHHLPPESAERLLALARRRLERCRRELAGEADPDVREQRDPEGNEIRLLLDEGRVLLARGDAAAALKELRRAEEAGIRAGRFLRLASLRGGEPVVLPMGSRIQEQLHLALAEAHLRLGDRASAVRRLVEARDLFVHGEESAGEIEGLQKALRVHAPSPHDVRGAPAAAADFTLEDLGGSSVTLSGFRGRVVLVMLWATW